MPSHEPDELIQAILEQRFVPLRLVAGNSCLHSAATRRRSKPRATERRRGAAISANDAWRCARTNCTPAALPYNNAWRILL
jgi:hypothetical protein